MSQAVIEQFMKRMDDQQRIAFETRLREEQAKNQAELEQKKQQGGFLGAASSLLGGLAGYALGGTEGAKFGGTLGGIAAATLNPELAQGAEMGLKGVSAGVNMLEAPETKKKELFKTKVDLVKDFDPASVEQAVANWDTSLLKLRGKPADKETLNFGDQKWERNKVTGELVPIGADITKALEEKKLAEKKDKDYADFVNDIPKFQKEFTPASIIDFQKSYNKELGFADPSKLIPKPDKEKGNSDYVRVLLAKFEEDKNRTKVKYKNDILSTIKNDTVIKELDEQDKSLESAFTQVNLALQGNSASLEGLSPFLTKAFGEVGNLNANEAQRYAQSGEFSKRMTDKVTKWTQGKLTKEASIELTELLSNFKNMAQKRRNQRVDFLKESKMSVYSDYLTEDDVAPIIKPFKSKGESSSAKKLTPEEIKAKKKRQAELVAKDKAGKK